MFSKHLYIPIYIVFILVLTLVSVNDSFLSSPLWGDIKKTLSSLQGGNEQLAGGTPITGQPAFPGAEGYGALARGGRGGEVLFVTNLNDSGPGSLRAAVEASGPRTVVFRVGGTIVLESYLRITNPYITIAGQTAPGGGITLRQDGTVRLGLLRVDTHDVVIRHIRSRPGPYVLQNESDTGSCCNDAIDIGNNAYNVIFDHVSASWGTDEVFSINNANNITIQWSIVSEGIFCSTDNFNITNFVGNDPTCPQGGTISGGAQLIGNQSGSINLTLHHNLYAHNSHRNVKFDGPGRLDFINNIVYDPGWQTTTVGQNTQTNYIGNLVKAGPITDLYEDRYLLFETGAVNTATGYNPEIYHTDNIVDTVVPEVLTQRVLNSGGAVVSSSRFSGPWVTEAPASQVQNIVLSDVGANRPQRDAVDSRIVSEVNNRTGLARINSVGAPNGVNHPNEVGGWPVIANGVAPVDSDNDGMPDSFEVANGLDPNNPSDRNSDADNDGYTNLEEYLNSLTSNPGDGVGGATQNQEQGNTGGQGPNPTSNIEPEEAGPPPTVTITAPVGNPTVSGFYTLRAEVVGSNLIRYVEFIVDGRSIRFDDNYPYVAQWNTTQVTDGSHTITVVAEDIFDQQDIQTTQVVVDNSPSLAQAEPSNESQTQQQNSSQANTSSPSSPTRTSSSQTQTTSRSSSGSGVGSITTSVKNTLNAIFPVADTPVSSPTTSSTQPKESGSTSVGSTGSTVKPESSLDLSFEERFAKGIEAQLTTPLIFYIFSLFALIILTINNNRKGWLFVLLLFLLLFGVLRSLSETTLTLWFDGSGSQHDIFFASLTYYGGVFATVIVASLIGLFANRAVGLIATFLLILLFLLSFVVGGVV